MEVAGLKYEPSNCRFATVKEQLNNKNDNHYITAFGETKTAALWSEDERCVVVARTLRYRTTIGWSSEEAITTPPLNGNHKKQLICTAFGKTKTLSEWTKDKRCTVTLSILRGRIFCGWDEEKAITTPQVKFLKKRSIKRI